ncbi:MAG: hypothetical protein ABMA14_20305 [Hyphomonadaceae bacterium]
MFDDEEPAPPTRFDRWLLGALVAVILFITATGVLAMMHVI